MAALQAILLTLAATGGGETVLLDFYSDTCPPCRQMAPAIDQLAARGYPIRKTNVAREPDLAARFRVGPIPCFVMVVDGREADRVVGPTSAARLEQMLALADRGRAGPQAPIQLAGRERSGPAPWAIPAVRSIAPFSASGAAPDQEAASPNGMKEAPVPARQLTSPDWAGGSDESSGLYARLVAATVRLRIKDAQGQSCGSGTIIDARKGEALILTCGHLFRDSHGKGPIEVDLFGPTPAERIPGHLVHYSLERDVGLVSISTSSPVTVARVAPPGFQIAKGAKVIHVGCNNGAAPTPRSGHVISLNRFVGPPNLEVSGLPVQGRSGGGLFTADGLLIGVCNAAIPSDNEGLYAALGALHAELDELQLGFVRNETGAGPPSGSALAAAETPSMPRQMGPPSEPVRWTEAPPQPAIAPDAFSAAGSSKMTPQEEAAWDRIRRRNGEGAEVICIIRRPGSAPGNSEVLVVDRASPAFLEKLAGSALPASLASKSPDAAPDDRAADWKPRWLQPGYEGE